MKILIVSQSFWPDKSGYLYGDIANHFKTIGHDIDIITYKYSNQNLNSETFISLKKIFNLYRIPIFKKENNSRFLKFINSIIFNLSILFVLFNKKKYDYVICGCSHLLFVGYISSLVARYLKSQFIYSIGDLHPESGTASGDFKNKYIIRILKHVDTIACNYAKKIVVLSDDMTKSVVNRGTNSSNNIIKIPNLPHNITKKLSKPNDKIFIKDKSKFRIVFTGNIGRFQGLETIIQAMKLLNDDHNIEIVFLGSGVSETKLKIMSGSLLDKSIFFIKPKKIEFVNSLIDTADIGLVSLLSGVEKCAFPSKMSGYLNMKCPILVIAEEKSELFQMTQQLKIGVSVPQNDPKILLRILTEISSKKNFKESYLENINHTMKSFYSKERILYCWENLLK